LHIPDGFLNTETWAAMWVVSGLVVLFALSKVKGKLKEKAVPLMGILAAFIFAAQMLNVPVGVGTSGHMLGGVLAAVLLGPFAASIVMVAVFVVQAIFFQDGGITALGANIFNMGLIGTILGFYIYKTGHRLTGNVLVGAAVAAWLAVVLASIATAIELAFSGTAELGIVLPAMAGIHAVIGIVEAAITVAVLAYVLKARPDLMKLEKV
jgi:cobalt/nickel transport system permease protein